MTPLNDFLHTQTRRAFLSTSGFGIGKVALATTMLPELARAAAPRSQAYPPLPGLPHFAGKAKRFIYLFMNGAPSQLDLFDYKPALDAQFDQDLPDSIRQGQRLTTMTSGQQRFPLAPSMYQFRQHGRGGAWLSELLPHTASIADDIAIVKTVHTEAINHDPAVTYIQTGNQLPGRPSLGSWLSYGLGSESENLPAYVVMTPRWSSKRDAQAIYNRLWSSAFLPSKHSGVALRSVGDPILFINNPDGVDRDTRRVMLDGLAQLNAMQFQKHGDPEINTRIAQYEMAYRMQASVPELMDFRGESKATLDLYGPDVNEPGTFASSCLLARRLIERGTRTVQIFHRGWDQHGSLPRDLPLQCGDVDQPSAALIKDLKGRGLLDDTLVVWGGEFGRTVYCQGKLTRDNYGRDHHPRCFTMWLAGGGVKGGTVYGETDDFSYNIVENPVHIHDLNATILHCLGIDHRRFTVKFQGLDLRLTGVEEAKVVKALLA